MSLPEQYLFSILSDLALAFDGGILGVALAYTAVRSLLKFTTYSSALHKIKKAPELKISDLRSILPPVDDSDAESRPSDQKVVIVRGAVETISSVDGSWKSNKVLTSQESGDKAVVIQRTQSCVYSEWKGIFQLNPDLRAILGKSLRRQESAYLRTIPFVLVEDGQQPNSSYVVVNMEGSSQPLPLTTVYHRLQPVNPPPYTFLQVFFGHEYPVSVALLDEEKILPPEKDITAVGICSFEKGIPEIKSCKDLPYFLSELTKDKMILDLASKTKVLFWSSVILGSVSIGILGYGIMRNWKRWKEWRKWKQPSHDSTDDAVTDENTDDIPDGQLCVVCLMRRRVPAFIPCGHIVCCQTCALTIERAILPKCPICSQLIRGSMRVYYA